MSCEHCGAPVPPGRCYTCLACGHEGGACHAILTVHVNCTDCTHYEARVRIGKCAAPGWNMVVMDTDSPPCRGSKFEKRVPRERSEHP